MIDSKITVLPQHTAGLLSVSKVYCTNLSQIFTTQASGVFGTFVRYHIFQNRL